MSGSQQVEGSKVFFLVNETGAIVQAGSFLQRRGVHVEIYTDVKDFLNAANTFRPDFVAISVNHTNPKVLSLVDLIGEHISCEVIVFAERPDRKSLPLIQRAKKAHQVMGAISGPALLLKLRKIYRKKEKKGPKEVVMEVIRDGSPTEDQGEADSVSTGSVITTDVRQRGQGPMIVQNSPKARDFQIWQERAQPEGDKKSLPFRGDLLKRKSPPGSRNPLSKEVLNPEFEELALWIEKGLKESVGQSQTGELKSLPETTRRLAVVQVQDAQQLGYVLLACAQDELLEAGPLLLDLHRNLKNLKPNSEGPKWDSFKILDVDIPDFQQWSEQKAQVLFQGQHVDSQLLASFVASQQSVPQLGEVIKGHLNIPVAYLRPDIPLDYDTFLHLYLNDRIIPYVMKGRSFSQKQLLRLSEYKGHPLMIRKEDLESFEKQFLKENILSLHRSVKKKAS